MPQPREPLMTRARAKLDSWLLITVFGALYFASQAMLAVIVDPLGHDMLFVQTTLSADEVRAIFARWEAAGLLDTYLAHYRFDMIHPLWYGVFLAALLAKGMNANAIPAKYDNLLLVPFVAAACDVVENFLHLNYIHDRATITTGNVLISNGAANLKWLLAIGSVVAVIALAVRAQRQRRA